MSITSSKTEPKRSQTLAQDLVAELTQRIHEGSLGESEKLPSEGAICSEYGVSRTVVREALSKLQAAGLVETRHGVGTFVVKGSRQQGFLLSFKTLQNVRDIIDFRMGIEPQAAAMAAIRRSQDQLEAMTAVLDQYREGHLQSEHQVIIEADQRFHLMIAEATGNAYFVTTMRQLKSTIIPRSQLNVYESDQSALSGISSIAIHEHDAILKAIRNKNPEAARAAMWLHLSNTIDRFHLA